MVDLIEIVLGIVAFTLIVIMMILVFVMTKIADSNPVWHYSKTDGG